MMPLQLTLLFLLLLTGCTQRETQEKSSLEHMSVTQIRFIPIGDSYTIGTGINLEEAWPALLTEHLRGEDFNVTLVVNPAQNGWTTQNAIDGELSIFEGENPTFATLLLGANDYVQNVPTAVFRSNLALLMDRMLAVLPNGKRLLVLTIPDFFATPVGFRLAASLRREEPLDRFNEIIQEEAQQRGLKVVDLFAPSKRMRFDVRLVAGDGLHPSVEGHKLFEEVIFPAAQEALL